MGNTLKHIKNQGFTLAELAIVIIVVGILAGITIVGYGAWQKNIARDAVKSDLTNAVSAMESARTFSEGGYPSSIPASFKPSDTVTITYGTGDASAFCIRGQSKKDASISFYARSSDPTNLQAGSCPAYVPPPPSTPTIAGATTTANTTALSWNAATGIVTDYETQMRPAGGTWSTARSRTVTNDSYTMPTAGQTFEFRVRAVNTGGASAWSSGVSRVFIPVPTIASITGEGCVGSGTQSYAVGTVNFSGAANTIAQQYLLQGSDGNDPRTVSNSRTSTGTISSLGSSSLWSYTSAGGGTFQVIGIGPNGERSGPANFSSMTYDAYYC